MQANNQDYVVFGKRALERLKELEASTGWK